MSKALEELKGSTDSEYFEVYKQEVRTCTSATERYPRNYYGWKHRLWAFDAFCSIDSVSEKVYVIMYILTKKVINYELEETYNWMKSHVRDYSNMYFRQHVLAKHLARQEKGKIKSSTITVNTKRS